MPRNACHFTPLDCRRTLHGHCAAGDQGGGGDEARADTRAAEGGYDNISFPSVLAHFERTYKDRGVSKRTIWLMAQAKYEGYRAMHSSGAAAVQRDQQRWNNNVGRRRRGGLRDWPVMVRVRVRV